MNYHVVSTDNGSMIFTSARPSFSLLDRHGVSSDDGGLIGFSGIDTTIDDKPVFVVNHSMAINRCLWFI